MKIGTIVAILKMQTKYHVRTVHGMLVKSMGQEVLWNESMHFVDFVAGVSNVGFWYRTKKTYHLNGLFVVVG